MRAEMKPVLPFATAILMAGLMTTTAIAASADATQGEAPHDQPAGHAITTRQRAALSTAAVKALRHIAQARGDLEGGNTDSARRQLDKAGVILDLADAALPATIVKDRIWVAQKHLQYEDPEAVLADLGPIYSSLDDLAASMPVQDARQHLDQAAAGLAKKDKDTAVAELTAATETLAYTDVDLPLHTTRRLLQRARNAMLEADTDAAETALKAAEDNVVFLSLSMHEPLAEADQSFWRAKRDYAAGARSAAQSEVHRAVRYLDYATNGADAATRKAIELVLTKARSLEAAISEAASDVPTQLDELWTRAKALSERDVESFASAGANSDSNSELKATLIEAKLHLSYALSDRFLAVDMRQARDELDQVGDFLAQAATQAPQDQNAEIEALRDRVLKLNATRSEDQLKDQYTALRTRLSKLIEAL